MVFVYLSMIDAKYHFCVVASSEEQATTETGHALIFDTTFQGLTLRGIPVLQLHDSAAKANRHRLRPIAGSQLFHDVLDVNFCGLFSNE